MVWNLVPYIEGGAEAEGVWAYTPEMRGTGGECILRRFMICVPRQILIGWPNQEEWDGRSMWHLWGEKGRIQIYVLETWEKETTSKIKECMGG